MRCVQANSINWTPFFSMASKINTRGSFPVGICKSLLQRIAQVVGLALDALTLPIRLPVSCLCPGSLKGKVKELPKKEKVLVENKKEAPSSKEVEEEKAARERKSDAKNIQSLEENKNKPADSSSLPLGNAVRLLEEGFAASSSPVNGEKKKEAAIVNEGIAENVQSLEKNENKPADSSSLPLGDDVRLVEKGFAAPSSPVNEEKKEEAVLENESIAENVQSLEKNENKPDPSSSLPLGDDVRLLEEGFSALSSQVNGEKKEETAIESESDAKNVQFLEENKKELAGSSSLAHGDDVRLVEDSSANPSSPVSKEKKKEAELPLSAPKNEHQSGEVKADVVKNEQVAVRSSSHEKEEEVDESNQESTSSISPEPTSESSTSSGSSSPTSLIITKDGEKIELRVLPLIGLSPTPAKPLPIQRSHSEKQLAESSSALKALNFNQTPQSGTDSKKRRPSQAERKAEAKAKRKAEAPVKKG